MDLHRSHKRYQSRRCRNLPNMAVQILLLLGLWISNTIIGCQAMPHPITQLANSISKSDDYERNYAVASGAPLLIPMQEEVILDMDTDFVMRCEDKEAIVWKYPTDAVTEEDTYTPDDQSRLFGRTLTVKMANHMSVGNYYCIKESSLKNRELVIMEDSALTDLANNNLASSIYVYVNDTENLLAPMPFPVIHVMQFQDVVIPCKPSMPHIEVLLTTPSGKTLASDSGVRYNPRLGFVFEVRSMEESSTYICRPKIPSDANEEESTDIELILGNKIVDRTEESGLTYKNSSGYNLNTTTTTSTAVPVSSVTSTTVISLVTNRKLVSVTNSSGPSVFNGLVPAPNYNVMDVGIGDVELIIYKNVNLTRVNHSDNMGYGDNNNNANDDDDDGIGHDDVIGDGYKSITPRSTTPSGDEEYEDNNGSESKIMADNELSNSFEHQTKESAKSSSFFGKRRSARGLDTTTRRTYRVSSNWRSTPSSITKSVDQPTITSTSRNHAAAGETFQLVCEIKMAHDVKFKAEWIVPDELDKARVTEVLQANTKVTAHHTYYENVLTVKNAKRSDSGKYICNITDHSGNKARASYSMLVLNMDETYIEIEEPNNYYEFLIQANRTIQLVVNYKGYPMPTLEWYKPDGSKLIPGLHKKYDIENKDTSSTLRVLDAHLIDGGIYTVNASNGAESKIRQFKITVADKPYVMMEDIYVHPGQKAHVQCHVKSHIKPTVTWSYQPCSIQPRWPSCNKNLIRNFTVTKFRIGDTPVDYIYDLDFIADSPSIVHCWADNNVDRTGAKAHVLIRDIEDNITVSGVNENDIIALGDEVTITCAAVAYYFANDLNWFDKDGEHVRESKNIKITSSTSAYSYKKSITFKHIQDSDQGSYECRASYINNDTIPDPKYLHIIAHEPSSPQMTNTNLGDNLKLERKLGESLELRCESHAIPKATVTWYKDDIELTNITSQYVGHMVIPYMRPEDQGHYKCVVANRLGVVEQTITVKITNIPGLTLGWIAGILILLLVLILLIIYLCIRVKRERKLLRELKAAGLANFEEGAMEQINPALTLDEQADLLPYDRGFEFSRDKLKLGKQLGAGAFGVVLKAHAEGIKPGEKESVVAVKMVKRSANNEVMRALVSELKIMVHLGQHLNVVNLLGAVTKNIAKRELMVIVEFCRYGNVQNFLMRNRKRFINQIHPQTGRIDPSIMTQRFSDNFELDRSGLKYVNLSFSNHQYINHMNNINNMNNYYSMNNRRNSDNEPRSGTRAGRPGSTGYLSQSEYYEGQVNTCGTEQTVMTTVPEGVLRAKVKPPEFSTDEDNIMSNNSVQPAWRSNYKPDSTEAMTITTTDLISWSFQVACGMEYLSSKKVLHGDLAARNILLCEDNIVKICDFGLARSMYKSDNYKKQGDAPLPIKWLALESLSDHIFSTYTDVWSFGIVMWELFSLAKVPYPEIDANQSLYLKLKDGYRMEKPPYANDDLYDIMLECWSTNAERRPLFNVLKERFAIMLGEEVTSHYVDLNEPYLRVNTEYMKRNQTDYLALMGSPDEMAPPPPKYVNGHILPEIRIDLSSDDYLQMSPNGDSVIFSPTRPKDSPNVTDDSADQPPNISTTSFNFPDNAAEQHSPTLANNLDSPVGKPPRNKKDGIEPLPEEIPMLHQGGAMEGSPHQPRKYAQNLQHTKNVPTPSPRHHIAETKLAAESENYVNVKSPKIALNNNGSKASEAFSNPSYQILKTAAEKGDPN